MVLIGSTVQKSFGHKQTDRQTKIEFLCGCENMLERRNGFVMNTLHFFQYNRFSPGNAYSWKWKLNGR